MKLIFYVKVANLITRKTKHAYVVLKAGRQKG